MFKLAILLFSFALESLAYDDTVRCNFTFPDSGLKNGRNQEINDETDFFEKAKVLQMEFDVFDNEKIEKSMENIRERLKNIPFEKGLRVPGKIFLVERFDETGLTKGNVKYFIRIWKHPPKEKFNMPTFKLR
ncbi:MAG: hypothetical protein N2252_01845 [Candidatus Kryptonium sp.]|nr:hypothetical protein [Candidatus Kryptonium sp.]